MQFLCPLKLKYSKPVQKQWFYLFGLILFCGSQQPKEINVRVQFRISFSFIILHKKVLFCRFSGGHAKNLFFCNLKKKILLILILDRYLHWYTHSSIYVVSNIKTWLFWTISHSYHLILHSIAAIKLLHKSLHTSILQIYLFK